MSNWFARLFTRSKWRTVGRGEHTYIITWSRPGVPHTWTTNHVDQVYVEENQWGEQRAYRYDVSDNKSTFCDTNWAKGVCKPPIT